MFFAEAKLAAMLDHPHVARIMAVGIDEDPFIAMELIVGESLYALITKAGERSERPLAPRLAALVIAEVCDALHAAHELMDPSTGQAIRLVHRDVSPQNILVGFDGVARLTDFGIAKALGFGTRTRTGEVKGKLPYMSPEQVMCEPIDRRSDLFSVGAVLFEVLTGKRMLGDGPEIEVLRRLATESIPTLSRGWPDAPEPLRSLHEQLVNRSVQQRPATAREVAERLRAFASTGEGEARELLAARMHELFPGRMLELSAKLQQAGSATGPMTQPTLRASALLHKRSRRVRAEWIVAAGAVVVGVLAAAVFASRSEQRPSTARTESAAALPSTAPSPDPASSPWARSVQQPSSPIPVASVPKPTASAASKKSGSNVISSTSSGAGPAPKPPTTARHDKLDENPF
jgi:eukaryotic-like serine/threonine-protein kinase